MRDQQSAGANAWTVVNYATARRGDTIVRRSEFKWLEYVRDGRSIGIDVEPGGTSAVPLAVFARCVEKWDDGAPTTEAERAEILRDIDEALGALHIDYELLWT